MREIFTHPDGRTWVLEIHGERTFFLKPDSEPCACETCREMCHRPCWPTPDEAEALIEAGFADRLCLEVSEHYGWTVNILAPAIKGKEGQIINVYAARSQEGCTFWTEDRLCELHDLGLKPYEGRVCRHDIPGKTWGGEDGSELWSICRDIEDMWYEGGQALAWRWRGLMARERQTQKEG